MSDPGRAVEVHGAVAVNGHVSGGNQEKLVTEIERTREDLARTIDTIAERVSPAHNVKLLRERVTEQAMRPELQLAAAAVVLGAVGLAILRAWGKRRHR